MKWKSQESRDAHFAAATDDWDRQILEYVEDLAEYLEAGKNYREYRPKDQLHVDQLGIGLVLISSEWDADGFIELLSGIEKEILTFYAYQQIAFQQGQASA